MEVAQVDEHIAVELQVSLLLHVLAAHHVDKRLIPFAHLLFLLWRKAGMFLDYSVIDAVEVELIGPDQILYLPHIKQIFRYILSFFC